MSDLWRELWYRELGLLSYIETTPTLDVIEDVDVRAVPPRDDETFADDEEVECS